MKSVQIRIFFWYGFSCIGLNTVKYGPEKTLYLDTFHAVINIASTVLNSVRLQTRYHK